MKSIVLALFGILFFGGRAMAQEGPRGGQGLSADGCVLHYIADPSRIERFNICSQQPLPDFNRNPLPDPHGAQQIQILPDGGMLVANVSIIARYQADGKLAAIYDVPGEDCWSGVALEKEGSGFWASSSCHAGVIRFNLNSDGRMFGGGTTYTSTGVQVNHGVDLHCDASFPPNYLQVTWTGGNVFFMENMTSVSCTGSPFNTISGTGSGMINGQAGATIQWTLVDAGQPGTLNDSAQIVIKNAAGEPVVQVSGKIYAGSHIAR